MPWMLLVLTVAGAVSMPSRAPRPLPEMSVTCPVTVTAMPAPPTPYRPGSVVAAPIPTRVDAHPCPIPLAGTVVVRP